MRTATIARGENVDERLHSPAVERRYFFTGTAAAATLEEPEMRKIATHMTHDVR